MLKELGYIKVRNQIFDLEWEKIKTSYELSEFLKKLFSGQKLKDKHGNILQLKTYNDRVNAIVEMGSDPGFNNLLKHKFQIKDTESFLNSFIY